MLVTTNPQRTLWEALLPPGYEQLPPRLARVDALLGEGVQGGLVGLPLSEVSHFWHFWHFWHFCQ